MDKPIYFEYSGKRLVMVRSYGKTTNGNPLYGRWAIYEIATGELLDFDQYRNDLFDKWDI